MRLIDILLPFLVPRQVTAGQYLAVDNAVRGFTSEEINEEATFINDLTLSGLCDPREATQLIYCLDRIRKRVEKQEWREQANNLSANKKLGIEAQGSRSFVLKSPGR